MTPGDQSHSVRDLDADEQRALDERRRAERAAGGDLSDAIERFREAEERAADPEELRDRVEAEGIEPEPTIVRAAIETIHGQFRCEAHDMPVGWTGEIKIRGPFHGEGPWELASVAQDEDPFTCPVCGAIGTPSTQTRIRARGFAVKLPGPEEAEPTDKLAAAIDELLAEDEHEPTLNLVNRVAPGSARLQAVVFDEGMTRVTIEWTDSLGPWNGDPEA